jgi:hypothetical protein
VRKKLVIILEFIEQMALSNDARLGGDDTTVLTNALKYLGEQTKVLSKEIVASYGWKKRSWTIVKGQEHVPIESRYFGGFLFYRYKFLSQAKDKNMYRLPKWIRT